MGGFLLGAGRALKGGTALILGIDLGFGVADTTTERGTLLLVENNEFDRVAGFFLYIDLVLLGTNGGRDGLLVNDGGFSRKG